MGQALAEVGRTYRRLAAVARTLNATTAAVNTAAKRDDLAAVADSVKDLPQLLQLARETAEQTETATDRVLAERARSRRRRRR